MNKNILDKLIAANRPLILDGATGTWLQSMGMPSGTSPEKWVLEHPAVLQDLQRAYLENGSSIIYAFTFGANRIKLTDNKIPASEATELNQKLARLTCDIRDEYMAKYPGRIALAAGDLAPTGQFLFPAGELSFSELVSIYEQQADALLQTGVDLFVIETMMDLAQVRAAVIAIRKYSDLPIMATVTLEANGRTLSGNGPEQCLLTLADMGVAAFGINCSHGPAMMHQWLQPLIQISPIPLIAKPNAGVPELRNGKTVFNMDPEEFSREMVLLADDGISILGGCCGTDPDYIASLKKALADRQTSVPAVSAKQLPDIICSSRRSWPVDRSVLGKLPVVDLSSSASLVEEVLEAAAEDVPAMIICIPPDEINPEVENIPDIGAALQEIQLYSDIPLVFKGENEKLLDELVNEYHGRAGIISHSYKEKGLLL